MLTKPFITVLLPVYNCEKYVFDAIASILNQTYSNFELLIIDDCSTDTTLQICKSFGDERIILIEKEKNSGYTNSLNYGIAIAKGKYIARMDGDDISLPTRFEKQVAFMEANEDVVVCGTTFSIINSTTVIALPELHEDIKGRLLNGNCIGHPTVMLRKNTLEKHAILYNPEMEPAEDYDMWTRLITVGKLHNLQETLLLYRVHESQVSNTRNEIQNQKTTDIKINLLKTVSTIISDNELKAYKNLIELNGTLTVQEFKTYVKLKKRFTALNKGVFFNTTLFKAHFFKLEKNCISKNFKNNSFYNAKLFHMYIKIAKLTNAKLTVSEVAKFFIKCLLNHKVK